MAGVQAYTGSKISHTSWSTAKQAMRQHSQKRESIHTAKETVRRHQHHLIGERESRGGAKANKPDIFTLHSTSLTTDWPHICSLQDLSNDNNACPKVSDNTRAFYTAADCRENHEHSSTDQINLIPKKSSAKQAFALYTCYPLT